MDTEPFLEDLERRIEDQVEDQLQSQWEAFTEGRFSGEIFCPQRPNGRAPAIEWPTVSVNRAQVDLDAMVLQQYGACSSQLLSGAGGLMTVRANYGTAILPSLFGAELFVMDEALNTLQTCRAMGGAAMSSLVDRGVPDLQNGLGAAVLAAGRRFAEIGRQYPAIGKYVHVYHPDLQGPMDVCELLWGSDMFVALIDQPTRVHEVLTLITDTYVRFMHQWNAVVGTTTADWATHWGMMHKGKIMLRTDSGMNLSPEIYDAFIRPYDQRLLAELGGGAVHFCGRGSHYIASTCRMDGLTAINLSQPHLNDMETVFRNTVDRGIKLLGFSSEYAHTALAEGRDLHAGVHCH